MTPLIQLLAVIRKEVTQILADRRMIGMLVVAPLIQLVVFGSAVDFEVDRVPTIVVDLDETADSRELVTRLLADGTLASAGTSDSPEEALRRMDRGEAAAVVVVDDGFDRDAVRGLPPRVQVVLDGTDPNRSNVAAAAVARYASELTPNRGVAVVPRIFSNPGFETSWYMVPGVAAMLLVVTTTLVTAMGLARERETGTLEQVLVTPIPRLVLLGGKVLPYVAIGLFDVALALGVGGLVFGVPIRGNLIFLSAATLLYLLSTLGVGLLISTVSTSQQQAFMGGFLFMLPSILLSGNMTPVDAMPGWMQVLTVVNPLRWYIELLRGILLEGSAFVDLWPNVLALLVLGSAVFTLAVLRFRTRLA